MTGLNLDGIFNETNSSLQKRAIYDDWIEVGAVQFDSKGNLWCTNSQTYEPISVKYANGEWESFSLGSGITETQDLAKLLIDKNVTTTAINIPKIPKKFPCLEVSGEERPLRAKINNTPEIK